MEFMSLSYSVMLETASTITSLLKEKKADHLVNGCHRNIAGEASANTVELQWLEH